MPFLYGHYGLWLSSDVPVAGLSPLPSAPRVDVRLRLGGGPALAAGAAELAWYVSPSRDERGRPGLTITKLAGGAGFRLRYCDGAEFVVSRGGSEVWAGAVPAPDLASYLLGPVLGFVLRLRGVTCLHASAVAVGGRAIALLGPAGAGKSTTAAAFARQGHPVLSDDILPLDEQGGAFLAQPGYPRLRLWAAAVEALASATSCLPRLSHPEEGKRLHLDLTRDGYHFQGQALPLLAVYLLDERRDAQSSPRVEGMTLRDGVLTLVANTYASTLLDRQMRAREFEVLSRLAGRISLRRLHPHSDPARLTRLCDVIRDDVRRLTAGTDGAGSLRSTS